MSIRGEPLLLKVWEGFLKTRIEYLDGLRGVAILLVLGYHAYARWPDIVPYGATYAGFPIFSLGWIGVELFFLISGFVIFMTLDKTASFRVFVYKRWLRLFPTMLVASILLYLTAPLLSERPAGSPELLSLLPGLSFIEPEWWRNLLGVDLIPLEGAFWSLYVEVKFYLISGIVYYYLGRKYLAPVLFLAFVFSLIVMLLSAVTSGTLISVFEMISEDFSLEYFGWFCAGAMFYLFHHEKKEKWFWMAFLVALLSSVFVRGLEFYPAVAGFLVSCLFALSLRVECVQRFLQFRPFIFFGFISYPLYLIHENAMISMIVKSSYYAPWLASFFYPFVPIVILSFIALFIASKLEPSMRRLIKKFGEPRGLKV